MIINPCFQRLTLLVGGDAAEALLKTRVTVFGLGGVGSWCAEALVRSGVGNISLVDFDVVCDSNINRQVQASSRTIGYLKTAALEERIKEINPSCTVTSIPRLFTGETRELFDIPGTDYVIDAIDMLESKLDLIETTLAAGVRLFSSMGMALKLDPTRIRTADIWETSGCPLARLVRQGLRKRNIASHFTVVYSPERLPRQSLAGEVSGSGRGRKMINGSAVTVTASAGMILASLVIRDVVSRYAPQEGVLRREFFCGEGGYGHG